MVTKAQEMKKVNKTNIFLVCCVIYSAPVKTLGTWRIKGLYL